MKEANYFVALSNIVNNVTVDGIAGDEEAWFTRKQIGEALEYSEPQKAIMLIHNRHKDTIDEFARWCQFVTPSGKQEGYVYSFFGVMEICRWSTQPKANMVMRSLYEMAKQIWTEGYCSTMNDSQLCTFLQNKINAKESTFNGAVAPAIVNTGMDIRDAANDIAFAAGYSDILCRPSAKLADFQLERKQKMELLNIWEERPYKNHFTYEDIPNWAKEKIKAKGYGPDRDRFPEMFTYLKRHDGNDRWKRNFCEVNKKYHFTKRGYERIIDYAVKNHMVYPNEADRWRQETGLIERN